MNSPNQVPTLNFRKLGLLAMTPIALVIHGLVLWIPVNTEIKKEKEPEKKEELQAIGDMPLPIAAPIASPSPKTATSTPAANPSAAASSPVVIEKIIEKVIETQPAPQSKPSEFTTPPITPIPPVAPLVTPEVVTPEDAIGKRMSGIRCPGKKKCYQIARPKDEVLKLVEEQYDNLSITIYNQPSVNGTRPEDGYPLAYKIQDKKTSEIAYFTLDLIPGTKNKVEFKISSLDEVKKNGGVL